MIRKDVIKSLPVIVVSHVPLFGAEFRTLLIHWGIGGTDRSFWYRSHMYLWSATLTCFRLEFFHVLYRSYQLDLQMNPFQISPLIARLQSCRPASPVFLTLQRPECFFAWNC